jgi:hypothetical protein
MRGLIVSLLLIAPASCAAQEVGTRLALQVEMNLQPVYIAADSVVLQRTPAKVRFSAVNIGGQVLVGATFSVLFSVPSLYAIGVSTWNGTSPVGGAALSLFFLSSYTFGTAVGVHVIADGENPAHSFWKAWMYSAIGAGVGIGGALVLGRMYGTLPGESAALLLCPLAGSMIYSLFVADWPGVSAGGQALKLRHPEMFSAQLNPVERTIIAKVSLITIDF